MVSQAVRSCDGDSRRVFGVINAAAGLSLSRRAGLWELAGVLERTHAAGKYETQGLKPAGKVPKFPSDLERIIDFHYYGGP